jgi:Spy/CpxP family protein refolding chaperone
MAAESESLAWRNSMKKTLILFLLSTFVLLASAGLAQQSVSPASGQTASDDDIKMLRADLRSDKKQIIAQNMQLTDTQAEKFWPVYDAYSKELAKLGDERQAIIQSYAKNFNTLTDAQADDLVKRMLAVDASAATTREQWAPKFRKVLTAKQTALFLQLDRRISLLIEIQVASIIPLVK